MSTKCLGKLVTISICGTLAGLGGVGSGCSSSSSSPATDASATDGAVTLYSKYGTAIPQVVDDAVTGLLADCEEAPYFAVVGTTGHDSVARLKSCLRLQFTVLMGGPGTYPGVNDMGDTCLDMTTIHTGLGIPSNVFDKFVADLGAVLAADGVSSADVTTIAGAVMPLKAQVVQTPAVTYNACDAGAGQ